MNSISVSSFNQYCLSFPLHVRPSDLQWEKLHMSKSERRKIFCSVLFHLIAIACMLWSVYVLVRRTAEEIRLGKNGQCFPPTPSPTLSHTRDMQSEMFNFGSLVALMKQNYL